MKFTIFLLTVGFIHVSAGGFSQNVTYAGTNQSLEKVFSAIEQQTGYSFFYKVQVLSGAKPVTVDFKNETIEDVLQELFQHQPLSYKIVDKNVVVTRKASDAENQGAPPLIDVHGHVTDSTGAILGGASVTIKGTHRGSSTDANGNFDLKDVQPNAVLVVSYTGYQTLEYRLNGNSNVSISLKRQINSLHDVVVNKGYYTTTERLNTGNVTKVSGEEINKQPVTDVLQALEGKVPGLYINQFSGIPGANSTVQLRGMNSLPTGTGKLVTANDPLYIVDGIPISSQSLTNPYISAGIFIAESPVTGTGNGISPFNGINLADIESVEVLKDADATSIYGSRGSNGVILITTKKGKVGKTQFDVSINQGVSKITRDLNLLNTKQYVAMRLEAFRNGNGTPDPGSDFDLTYWDSTHYTDWQKILIGNPASYTNAQISASGGSKNTQFLLGVGYVNQGTVFPGSYSNKTISFHLSASHTSENQRFKMEVTASHSNNTNNEPLGDYTGSVILAPDAPALYNKDGSLNWAPLGGTATWSNPMAGTNNSDIVRSEYLAGSLNLRYQLLKDIQITSNFGYSENTSNENQITRATSSAPPNNTNPYSRAFQYGTNGVKTWSVEPQVNFHHKINKLNLTALLGATFQESVTQSDAFLAAGYTSDAVITNPAAASYFAFSGSDYTQYRYNAAYGRVGADWDQKYIINITGRRDGSSRFGPGKQFGNFGAIGAAWIFSKETAVQESLSWLSFGKLRASYGTTGNDKIGDYQYLSTYSLTGTPTYQGVSPLNPTGVSNPYFAWELDKKLEGSIDLGFIHDRIRLSASFYRNRTDNQLVGYPLPVITGFSRVEENLPAILQNTGWEIILSTLNLKIKDFEWSMDINISIPRDKLVAFPNIQNTSYVDAYSVGKSVTSRLVYHYTGVDPQTGIYTFASQLGSGNPQPKDRIWSKPVTRDYFGGISNTFKYKGLQLDIFIQFVKQLGYNYIYYQSTFPGTQPQNVQQEVFDNRWQKPGDNATVQKFSLYSSPLGNGFVNFQQSDGVFTDASFVRIKNVSLSYNLHGAWIKRLSLVNSSLYIQCQNLFTITKYLGLDPESQGIGLPPFRTITGGIKLSF